MLQDSSQIRRNAGNTIDRNPELAVVNCAAPGRSLRYVEESPLRIERYRDVIAR